MIWDESKDIIRKAWEDDIETDDGSYYRGLIEKAIGKKELFLRSAKEFGTPQYILEEDVLKEKALSFIKTFRKHIPNSEFFYALKSNDLPYLAKKVTSLGYNADVAGLFELKLALKLGFEKIIFTGPGKSDEELALAIRNSEKVMINADNEDELDRIISMAGSSRISVSIRVNPDRDIMKNWSKFGVPLGSLKEAIKKAKESKSICLKGLHFHSSWNDSPERYCRSIKAIGEFLKENLNGLEFLDIGGGICPESQATLAKFTHRYVLEEVVHETEGKKIGFDWQRFFIDDVDPLEKFGKEISESLKKYIFPFNKDIRLYLEPGRYISNNSTHILLKVIAEKGSNVIADGGMNLIGGLDFSKHLFSPIVNLSRPSPELSRKIIYGSLCKADDLWGYSYFGKGCCKGDILIVMMQGSYTFSRAWRLIKENAPYVAISNNKLVLAKEKEKFEDRYSGCLF
ncbi:alanine racemase [Candidatus Woesearchaeota archaeon]|nr:alanine racemase [Candidatus Woesearchaeota archaeon]